MCLQTINQRWDGSLVVRVGEQNQLFVDEVVVGEVSGLGSIQVLLKTVSNKNVIHMLQSFFIQVVSHQADLKMKHRK